MESILSHKITSILSLTLICISLTACSSKNPTKETMVTNECGENTTLTSAAVGAIVGGITANVLQQSTLIGAAVGGIVGTIGGHQLSLMQCKYKGKEALLLKQIDSTITDQNNLASETHQLNSKMSKLYKEIELLQTIKDERSSRKELLLSNINLKKEEVLKLQSLSDNVKEEITQYYKDLEENKYSEKDNSSIKHSLESLMASLHSIEKSSIYNLDQLDKFEKRVNRA